MQNKKATVLVAADQVNEASERVKPEPPVDLWEQLDSLIEEVRKIPAERPAGVFTVNEFAAKKGLHESSARRKLNNLMKLGKLERIRLRSHWGYRIV